jgi:hypothetical protein
MAAFGRSGRGGERGMIPEQEEFCDGEDMIVSSMTHLLMPHILCGGVLA